jgi:hypothetical protein
MAAERLAGGEYNVPEAAKNGGWDRFLIRMEVLAPDVLATLQADVLPVYAATRAEIEHYRYESVLDTSWSEHQKRHDGPSVALMPLRQALEAWGERWHLTHSRALSTALDTLAAWDRWPELGRQTWQFPGRGEWLGFVDPEELEFSFRCDGWDPTLSTRQEASGAIHAAFEEKLQEYLDVTETRVVAAGGFERAKEYRSLDQHMDWLVRYQCLGESLTGIARSLPGGRAPRETVGKPVRELARQLQIELRGSEGGRPQKPAT